MQFQAPRNLNAPVRCKFSHLKKTDASIRASTVREVSKAAAEEIAATKAAYSPEGAAWVDDLVVYLDLYRFHESADKIWDELVFQLKGSGFRETAAPDRRAREACAGRRILVIVEGGEEANGVDGRPNLAGGHTGPRVDSAGRARSRGNAVDTRCGGAGPCGNAADTH